jgi:hypothetical protein
MIILRRLYEIGKGIIYWEQYLLDSCRLCYPQNEECVRYYFKAGIPPLHLLLRFFLLKLSIIYFP